eukprot:6471117-Amphidinium_carterae.3
MAFTGQHLTLQPHADVNANLHKQLMGSKSAEHFLQKLDAYPRCSFKPPKSAAYANCTPYSWRESLVHDSLNPILSINLGHELCINWWINPHDRKKAIEQRRKANSRSNIMSEVDRNQSVTVRVSHSSSNGSDQSYIFVKDVKDDKSWKSCHMCQV